MDILKQKTFEQYDYISRYNNVPYYYNTQDDRHIYGLTTNMKTDSEWVAHKVKFGDTLHKLALKYYNNPSYWWIIACFNNIQDSFLDLYDNYTVLKIPSMTSLEFGKERK